MTLYDELNKPHREPNLFLEALKVVALFAVAFMLFAFIAIGLHVGGK